MAKPKNDPPPKNPRKESYMESRRRGHRVQPLTEQMGDFDFFRPYFGLLDFLDPKSYNGDQRIPYNFLFPEGSSNGMLSTPLMDDDYSYYTRPNQSIMEKNAAYNAFRQNYERSQSENTRESAAQLAKQFINRGYREPIIQPSAPQSVSRYPSYMLPDHPLPSPLPRHPLPSPKPSPSYPMPNPGGFTPPKPIQPSLVPLPMPGTRVPPSSGKFGGLVPLPYPQTKPPIYKSPPKYEGFAPQPAPQPSQPISDKLPLQVRSFLNSKTQKKPTLNSFIPRYERD